MQSLPYWPKVHALVIAHKSSIYLLFLMASIVTVVFALVASLTFQYSRADYGLMISFGNKLGSFALICYFLTLLPGILKRLDWFPLERSTLMLFRRNFGVLMFLAAYVHGLIVFLIPMAYTTGFTPEAFSLREQLGMFASVVLFPLWLTSNSQSVRFLGKWWKVLHRGTYIALLLIFLHVLFTGELSWKLAGAGMIGLEAWSWIRALRKS